MEAKLQEKGGPGGQQIWGEGNRAPGEGSCRGQGGQSQELGSVRPPLCLPRACTPRTGNPGSPASPGGSGPSESVLAQRPCRRPCSETLACPAGGRGWGGQCKEI